MEDETVQLRETWLYYAAHFLFEHMQRCGMTPVPVRVSCGWPLSGGASKQATIGQCFSPAMCSDGVAQVFISPRIAESVEVLGVLLHELIHASFGPSMHDIGHGKQFSQAAKKLGLAGPPTATVVSPELLPFLQSYVARVGVYPHAPIVPRQKAKAPGSRLRLYECCCDPVMKVRVASNDFDATCNRCDEAFTLVEKDE